LIVPSTTVFADTVALTVASSATVSVWPPNCVARELPPSGERGRLKPTKARHHASDCRVFQAPYFGKHVATQSRHTTLLEVRVCPCA
jgi:hypothetical protein